MIYADIMQRFPITEYQCGHYGRTNKGVYAKKEEFIRVAEKRNAPVLRELKKPCPDCK